MKRLIVVLLLLTALTSCAPNSMHPDDAQSAIAPTSVEPQVSPAPTQRKPQYTVASQKPPDASSEQPPDTSEQSPNAPEQPLDAPEQTSKPTIPPGVSFTITLPTSLPERPQTLLPTFYDTLLPELTPSKAYGAVYPYIGGYEYSTDYDARVNVYGFFAENGKAICGPAYRDLSLVNLPDGTPVYYTIISKSYTDGSDYDPAARYAVIWSDGSRILECDSFRLVNYETYGPEYLPIITTDMLTYRIGDKWGLTTFAGKEILPPISDQPIIFTEGLGAVVTGDTYHYVNATGKTVLGPYACPTVRSVFDDGYTLQPVVSEEAYFSSGLSIFYDGERTGYINKSSKIAIPALYIYATPFINGHAMVQVDSKDENFLVINTRGETVRTVSRYDAGYDSWDDYPYMYEGLGYYNIILGDTTLYFTADGTVTEEENQTYYENGWLASRYRADDGKWENSYTSPDGSFTYTTKYTANALSATRLLASTESVTFIIIDEKGNTIYNSGSSEVFTYDISSRSNRLIVAHERSVSYTIIDFDGNTIFDYTGGYIYGDYMSDSFYITQPVDSNKYGAVDLNGNRLLPEEFDNIERYGDFFIVEYQGYGGVLDKQGNWLIRVPLQTNKD